MLVIHEAEEGERKSTKKKVEAIEETLGEVLSELKKIRKDQEDYHHKGLCLLENQSQSRPEWSRSEASHSESRYSETRHSESMHADQCRDRYCQVNKGIGSL